MKHLKRWCSVLLVLLMLSGLISCKNDKSNGGGTTGGTETNETPVDLYDQYGYWKDQLPEGLNFNAETVKVLGWTTGKSDFFAESLSDNDLIQSAVYARNRAVETRLNINLTFELTSHNTNGDFLEKVSQNCFSGLNEFDLLGGYTRDIASCIIQGYLQDMGDLTYTNLDNPWWPASLKDKSIVNGKLYFASGDIAPSNITSIGVVYFNKTMIGSFDLENPYDLVDDGTWTLDKMLEMAKDIYVDDGETSGQKDDKDTYGYMSNALQSQQLYWGAGMSWVEVIDGKYALSSDFVGVKMESYLSKLCTMFHTWEGGRLSGSGVAQFSAGKVLFITNALSYSKSHFSSITSFNYGIVPSPKWSAEQDQYYGSIGNATTLYAIPTSVNRLDKSDATLEALASESYRSVSPVICDTALTIRYAPDENFRKIFDILRNGIVYEPGRIFNNVFEDCAMANAYNICVTNNNPNFIAYYEGQKNIADNIIKTINGGLK